MREYNREEYPDLLDFLREAEAETETEPATEPATVDRPSIDRPTKVETFPCSECGKFAFDTPTVCYWCRRR